MYYLIYKITNTVNGKIYVGSHKTNNQNDGYMGSGKYLNYAFKKHGMGKFLKEILFVYDNAAEMYAKEAEIVNEDFLSEENTYNLKRGGFGGFDYINRIGKNIYGKNGQLGYGGNNLHKGWNRIRTPEEAAKQSATLKDGFATGRLTPSFTNRQHTEQAKENMRQAKAGQQTGELNSQYGTCWINHATLGNKKIKKDEIAVYTELGYVLGRKINK